jgi:hypothetical protein
MKKMSAKRPGGKKVARKDRTGRRELVGHRRAGISATGKTEDRPGVTGEVGSREGGKEGVNDRKRQEGQEQEERWQRWHLLGMTGRGMRLKNQEL